MAAVARHGPDIEHADPRKDLPARGPELVAQQLVAAADREHHRAGLHCFAEARALPRDEVCSHHRLLAVLPPAEEEQVVGVRIEPVSQAQALHVESDAAPGGPPLEREDVPPVPVGIHQLGVEMPEA
jgi:hypothetical protein